MAPKGCEYLYLSLNTKVTNIVLQYVRQKKPLTSHILYAKGSELNMTE